MNVVEWAEKSEEWEWSDKKESSNMGECERNVSGAGVEQ